MLKLRSPICCLALVLSGCVNGNGKEATAVKEKKKEVRYCCMAMTATCLACSEGISIEEFCKKKPKTQGCGKLAQ